MLSPSSDAVAPTRWTTPTLKSGRVGELTAWNLPIVPAVVLLS